MAKRRRPMRTVSLRRRFDWRHAAIALAGLVGSWIAFSLAVAGVTRTNMPNVALRLVPGEPIALTAAANQDMAAAPTRPPERVRTLALEALRGQALNPYALRVLAYFYGSRAREDLAMRYIRLADGQTRRDAAAQFLLIEDAVRAGDVPGVLRRYDIVFRVEPKTYVSLFPILLSAIDDKAVRTALVPYVREDRSWMPAFLTHAVGNSQNLPALVDLIVSAGGFGASTQTGDLFRAMAQRLVTERRFDLLRRSYLALPNADPSRLTRVAFDRADVTGLYGAVGWQARSTADTGSSFTTGNGAPITLAIYANSGTTDVVATKVLALRPGAYAMSAAVESVSSPDAGNLEWQMRCMAPDASTPFWTLRGASNLQARFSVPVGCQAQELSIRVDAGSSQDEVEFTVRQPSLRRLAN